MKYLKFIIALTLAFFQLGNVQQAISGEPSADMLAYLRRTILESPELAYDYTLFHSAGGSDTIKGRLSVTPDFIHDVNSQQVLIKTQRWLFQVDHNMKTVIVADLSKLATQPRQGSMIMQKSHALAIADSLVLKYGNIATVNTDNTLSVKITFPEELLIKTFEVDLDKKKKLLRRLTVVSDKLYHINEDSYEEEYIQQTLSGTNFSKSVDSRLGSTEQYFAVKDGKIILKKFKDYKLITINK